MASLQARHGKHCTLWPWSTFKAAASGKGCTCVPLYHVVHRDNGKLVRDPVGHNRREAERALDARRGDIARNDYHVISNVTFELWADSWIADVQAAGGKASTINAYRVTLEYAKRAIGKRIVRDLDSDDVSAVLRYIKQHPNGRKVSDTTLAKHMRQLSSCLGAAVPKYATSNPVAAMSASVRPRITKRGPSYFTNAELQRLWPELVDRPVYLALFKTAVATGMRRGDWLRSVGRHPAARPRDPCVAHILRGRGGDDNEERRGPRARSHPASRPGAARLVRGVGRRGARVRSRDGRASGQQHSDAPCALSGDGARRHPARGRARDGCARCTASGHTFARIALEQGTPIVWVKEQLGHASIDLTVDTYGSWERAAQKKQAESLAGVFPI